MYPWCYVMVLGNLCTSQLDGWWGCIVAANLVPDAVTSPELKAKLAKDREARTFLDHANNAKNF